MKKTIYAFAVVSSLFLVSCGAEKADDASGEGTEQSKDDEKDEEPAGPTIVGTWQLSDYDMGIEIPEEQKEMFDKMMEEMKENTSMMFNADGTFTSKQSVNGEVKEESGTYKLDGNKLSTTADGKTEELDVELSESSLVIILEERGQKMSMAFVRK